MTSTTSAGRSHPSPSGTTPASVTRGRRPDEGGHGGDDLDGADQGRVDAAEGLPERGLVAELPVALTERVATVPCGC